MFGDTMRLNAISGMRKYLLSLSEVASRPTIGGLPVRSALRRGLNRSMPTSKRLPTNAIVAGLEAAPNADSATAVAAPPMPLDCMP